MSLKRLNIEEIYHLYRILGDSIKLGPDDSISDSMVKVINGVTKEVLFSSLSVMYGENYKISRPNTAASMFMDAIRINKVALFYVFMNGIKRHANVA